MPFVLASAEVMKAAVAHLEQFMEADDNGGKGKIGGHGLLGTYLTTTSTYFKGERTAAAYGVFTSAWTGGTFDQIYASNFNDSGFYIGQTPKQTTPVRSIVRNVKSFGNEVVARL